MPHKSLQYLVKIYYSSFNLDTMLVLINFDSTCQFCIYTFYVKIFHQQMKQFCNFFVNEVPRGNKTKTKKTTREETC